MTNSNEHTGSRTGDVPDSEYVRELEQYRRRLDGAMFAGNLSWWEMDVETGAVQFHENKVQMLGASPEDFEHYEDFTELLHPDDYERAMQAMRDHLEGKADRYDVEYRIRTSGGEYRWFHDVGGVTEVGDDGEPQKVTGVVVDITRRKRTEEQLRRKNEQLSLLNRIVRHDIRNDMSVVTGWLDILREGAPPEKQEQFERVLKASQHTIELTRDVRDLVEIIEGDCEDLTLDAVALDDVVESELDRVQRSFPEAELHVGDLPEVTVEANAMLSSVVGNLLNNAVQHNDQETPRIDVDVDVGEESVRLHVADNGPGIPPERRESVFEMETKGPGSDGTGLGLYLVSTLVEAYGGDVWITDNEPRGAVVVVELRRVRSD